MSVRCLLGLVAAIILPSASGCAWVDPPTPTTMLAESKAAPSPSEPAGPTPTGGLDTIGDAAAPPADDAGPLVPLPGDLDAGTPVAITAGFQHTCALSASGAAYCWGANGSGQLGDGTTTDRPLPTMVAGVSSVTAIAAGANHTCALSNDDGGASVRCWGKNDHGQLGDGTMNDSAAPVAVAGLHAGVTAIAAGASHVCALVNDGVQCWGANAGGQLGNGTTADSASPVVVTGLGVPTSLAAGGEHSCAVVAGALHCWGWNEYGQLGDGTTVNRTLATAVPSLGAGVTSVSAGAANTCVIVGGGVQCWGYGQYGQVGDGVTTDSHTPAAVSGFAGAQAQSRVSAGCMFACALGAGGGVMCWGNDQSGQVGDNDPDLLDKTVATAVTGVASGATAIATGTSHACAIVGGAIQCWGWDVAGQLGNDYAIDSATPVTVVGF